MKARTFVFIALVGVAAVAVADPRPFQPSSAAPAHPALYSFADVYRLTVAGTLAGAMFAEAPADAIRVAAQAQPPAPRFSVEPPHNHDTWLLLLAGLALAGWVAHRRLVHAL